MTVTKEHLFQIHSVTNPILSPNEEEAVFLRTVMIEQENAYATHLFHIQLDTGVLTQWTFGHASISNPQWSPSGEHVSFLKKVDKTTQVFMKHRHEDEPQQLTHIAAGVSTYLWNPCGRKLWLTTTVAEGYSFGELADEQDEKFPQPYEVAHVNYKQDGLGKNGLRKKKEYEQIAQFDVATKTLKAYTTDAVNHTLHTVSHSGEQLVLAINDSGVEDENFTTLVIVDIKTGSKHPFLQASGSYGNVTYSMDDRYIAYSGHDLTFKHATQNALYVYDTKTNWTDNLTSAMDIYIGDAAVADVQLHVQTKVVTWTETNDLYCQVSTMGDVRLYYVTLEGAVYPATPEYEHVYSYALFKSGNRVLATISNDTFPGELFDLDITTGERKQLTYFNDAFLKDVSLSKPEQLIFEQDGHMLYGRILKPIGFEEGKKYPLIVEIHGGPHTMYGNTFFHEHQLLTAEGYGVLYINPRGSHGYSQAFANAVRNDYGGVDFQDIMAAVDEALAIYEWIDRERLGVTGGSYGGFLTNWIVSQTNRFKAAVTLRSISNWISFYGVSDNGYYSTEWQIGTDMHNAETLWQHSPLKYASHIETPLLIMHSEEDFRCPIEQAEQLYTVLKQMKKDVSFIRFPESDHNLSRTGKPNLRQARLAYMLEWFERYL